jgi:hypothetical protein
MTLSGIAAVGQARFGRWLLDEAVQRLARKIVEPGLTVFQARHELFAHAPRPIALDVIGDTRDRNLAIRLGAKEIADVVGHLHQLVAAAHRRLLCHDVGAFQKPHLSLGELPEALLPLGRLAHPGCLHRGHLELRTIRRPVRVIRSDHIGT